MTELKNLWPVIEIVTEEYVAQRRESDDAFMATHGITKDSHIEYDWGQIGNYYVSEWKPK